MKQLITLITLLLPFDTPVIEMPQVDRAKDKDFFNYIGIYGEGNHGNVPKVSNDAQDKKLGRITYDIGYGHKLTKKELETGMIYGIPFGKDNPLSEDNIIKILNLDMANNLKGARAGSWDRKLKSFGSSWEELSQEYQLPLMSLTYNVGSTKASDSWEDVLKAAVDKDEVAFARELRRKDAGDWTKGMDNRVMKELYGAGFIKDKSTYSKFKSVLPEADWKDYE